MPRVLGLVFFLFFWGCVTAANVNGANVLDRNINNELSKMEIRQQMDDLIAQNSYDISKGVTKQGVKNEILNWIEHASRSELREEAGGKVASKHCYLPKGRSTCAPQFIIAGSMKCGTTSLHTYLLNHPQVLPLVDGARLNGKEILAMKEIRFFNEPTFSRMLSKYNMTQTLAQYFNLFRPIHPPNVQGENGQLPLISGDATPMYVCQEAAAQRAYSALPEAKVIIMVRDPVDRIYSEFWFRQSLRPSKNQFDGQEVFGDCIRSEMRQMEGCNVHEFVKEKLTLDSIHEWGQCLANISMTAIRDKCKSDEFAGMCTPSRSKAYCTQKSVRNSFYISQILEWKEMYGDNLLIVRSEDFYEDTNNVMDRITKFLELEPFDWSPITKKAFNIVSNKDRSVDIVSKNSVGLSVGGMDAEQTNKYPPMDPALRQEFEEFFRPLNDAFSRELNLPKFW